MFPTEGVDGPRSILDWSYRGVLRENAIKSLMKLVSKKVEDLKDSNQTSRDRVDPTERIGA